MSYARSEMRHSDDKVSVRQAAVDSGMSEAWWRRQIWLRRVPFYRVGGRILISRCDIDLMFRKGRVEPSSANARPAGDGVT